MNFILNILLQNGNRQPDNYTKTTIEITKGGYVFIGILIGVFLTLLITKIIKTTKENNNTNNSNETNNNSKKD